MTNVTEVLTGVFEGYQSSNGDKANSGSFKPDRFPISDAEMGSLKFPKGMVIIWGEKGRDGDFPPVMPEGLKNVKPGTKIMCSVSMKDEYNGVRQFYLDRNKPVKVLTPATEQATLPIGSKRETAYTQPVSTAPDWDAKDRRIAREAAVKGSVEMMKIFYQGVSFSGKKDIDEVESQMFDLAAKMENWYYRPNRTPEPDNVAREAMERAKQDYPGDMSHEA